jgi:hypothetical protein
MAEQQTSFGQQLGDMYKRWVLDCIVNLGYAVSVDFSNRPELYQKVDNATATKLTNLQSKFGFDPNFPNMNTRLMLMRPIFGESDGHGRGNDGSAFQTARMPSLAAAADFAENAQENGFPMLRERVRSAIVPFKNHMAGLEGSSLSQTDSRTTSIFNTAQSILKDRDVFIVFGINGDINPDWPLVSNDPEGAKLIEKITTQLTDTPYGPISRERFVRMQRIAEKGSNSIVRILQGDIENKDDELDQLITQLYAWGSDLGLIGGTRPQRQYTRALAAPQNTRALAPQYTRAIAAKVQSH